jgi:hypothetical protein
MKTTAQPIDVLILRSMRSSRSASVFSLSHFDGLGSAVASRATLWRMTKAGLLQKIELLPGSFRLRRADLEAIAAGQKNIGSC